MLAQKGDLATYGIRHHDQKVAAVQETLVCKATRKDHQTEGVQGFAVNVSVKFATARLTVEQADAVMRDVQSAIYENPDPVLNGIELTFLSIEPGGEVARSDTKKLRVRELIVPLIAAL